VAAWPSTTCSLTRPRGGGRPPRGGGGGGPPNHAVAPAPAAGARPPYELYVEALASGRFEEDEPAGCGSLRVLVRRRD
jgi:hypothetical protein